MESVVAVATVIGALAQAAIAIMLALIAYYVVDILRRARNLSEKVQEEGEEIIEDIEEARERADEPSGIAKGAGLAAEVIADMVGDRRKRRSTHS